MERNMQRVTVELFMVEKPTAENIQKELIRKMESNRLVYTIEPFELYCVVYKDDTSDPFAKPQVFRTPAENELDAQNIFKNYYPDTDALWVEQCEDPNYAINRWTIS
jgi:hypothetical protein